MDLARNLLLKRPKASKQKFHFLWKNGQLIMLRPCLHSFAPNFSLISLLVLFNEQRKSTEIETIYLVHLIFSVTVYIQLMHSFIFIFIIINVNCVSYRSYLVQCRYVRYIILYSRRTYYVDTLIICIVYVYFLITFDIFLTTTYSF